MEIKKLCYILEIAKQQNISKAAKNLGLTQPALSKYLSNLEAEIGTPLFFSNKRQMIPSPAGSIYIEAARKAIQVRERTWEQIAALSQEKKQTVSVGVTGISGSDRIGKLIPEIYREFPNVSVKIMEEDTERLLQLLRQGRISMAILGIASHSQCPETFYQFSEEELLVCIPAFYHISSVPDRSLSGLPAAYLNQFSDIPFILQEEGTSHFSAIQELMKETGFFPVILYRTGNFFVMQKLASEGMGAFFLIAGLAERIDLRRCRIYALQERPTIRFGVVGKHISELQGVEKYLIYRLIEEARNEASTYFVMNEASKLLMDEDIGL